MSVEFEQPSWETPKYPDRHVAPVGARAGAANVYELDPGAVGSPLHVHHVVEYPDTGATLVVLAEQRLAYPHGTDAHQTRVVTEAMRAAADRDA